METLKQSGLWSSLGTHGSLVVMWWLCISSSGETRKFDILSPIWPWRSRSIVPQNNKDLNQGILHLLSKFGDNTRRPKLASGKNCVDRAELFQSAGYNQLTKKFWIGLDLFNDHTRPSGHISRPTQVDVSQSCSHFPNKLLKS